MGVRGDESTTESGDTSELEGEVSVFRGCRSDGTEVQSEPVDSVTSEDCVERVLTVVEGAFRCVRAGLAVFTLDGGGGGALAGGGVLVVVATGDFPRIVLGWLLVFDVKSVISISPDLTLEFGKLGVMRVPLSTLCLPDAISFSSAKVSTTLRMLFALAVFLRSAPLVAVSGGEGGGRVGLGGEGVVPMFFFCSSSASTDSDAKGEFAWSTWSSRL